ncbi:hypothetical protein F511_46888 [Dorcoceras hygrometricum]|uniref:Uncharacterized protein n=1 Tax=Dorcoceras hygrometricum TaxID=472368 RepID=A0A2Z6ZSC3_9LAMI|nr:hypothetical protein F511_46888 [Dorcoceras hygrometricum]
MPRRRRAWRRPSACVCAQAAARDERTIAGRRCYSFAQMLRGIAPRLVDASRKMLRPLATRWPAVGATLIARVFRGGAPLTASLRQWRLEACWPCDGRVTLRAAARRAWRGVARLPPRDFSWWRPPLQQCSGDVVTAGLFSRVWFGPVPGSP